jgi:predicted lactoylglutathione lyase
MADRKLTVSLPVRDLARSREFFAKLGFAFDPQFTGEQVASVVINAGTSVMLAPEAFFKTLTERAICDTSTHLQALLSMSCASRAEVDELVQRAIDAGGRAAGASQDHGFMYDWAFYDLDGHGWGVYWMDPSFAPK